MPVWCSRVRSAPPQSTTSNFVLLLAACCSRCLLLQQGSRGGRRRRGALLPGDDAGVRAVGGPVPAGTAFVLRSSVPSLLTSHHHHLTHCHPHPPCTGTWCLPCSPTGGPPGPCPACCHPPPSASSPRCSSSTRRCSRCAVLRSAAVCAVCCAMRAVQEVGERGRCGERLADWRGLLQGLTWSTLSIPVTVEHNFRYLPLHQV